MMFFPLSLPCLRVMKAFNAFYSNRADLENAGLRDDLRGCPAVPPPHCDHSADGLR